MLRLSLRYGIDARDLAPKTSRFPELVGVALVVLATSCMPRGCDDKPATRTKPLATAKGPVEARLDCEVVTDPGERGGVLAGGPGRAPSTQVLYVLRVGADRKLTIGRHGGDECMMHELEVDPGGGKIGYRQPSKGPAWSVVHLGGGARLLDGGEAGGTGPAVEWAKVPSLDACLDGSLRASVHPDVLAELRERRGAEAVIARLAETANKPLTFRCEEATKSALFASDRSASGPHHADLWIEAMSSLPAPERDQVRRALRKILERGDLDATALARAALWSDLDAPSLDAPAMARVLDARVRDVVARPASDEGDLAAAIFLHRLIAVEPELATKLGCEVVKAGALRNGIGDAALLALARAPRTCPALVDRLEHEDAIPIACCASEDAGAQAPCDRENVRSAVEAELALSFSTVRERLACEEAKTSGISPRGRRAKLALAALYAQGASPSKLAPLCPARPSLDGSL